jgi:hypothetical protein
MIFVLGFFKEFEACKQLFYDETMNRERQKVEPSDEKGSV